MDKRRLGALIFTLMLAVTTLGICVSISATSRAPGLDPRVYVEAHATATAIAPAIVPTMRYNEFVLPTLQAEEANQITETTKRKYENARTWNDFVMMCGKVAVGALTILAAIATACAAGAFIGLVICYIVERAKRAIAYEPVQVIPAKPLIFPGWKMLADPRTGLVIPYTTAHPASVEHGTLLIEARTGNKFARYRFTPRNGGERVPLIDAIGER